MTTPAYDVIVIGLGAHGSAAAYHLAKRGATVLGLERFPRGHTLGSSGGLSRIIRVSYYEHPDYVPLLQRAWDLWRELETESGEALLTQTGGLYLGRPDGDLVTGARLSARTHGLAHEELDTATLRERYPLFRGDDGWIGLFDVQAGWLAPERCIETHLRMAERHGAALRFEEPARWEKDGDGVRVTTDGGGLVALGQGCEDGLGGRRGETERGGAAGPFQVLLERKVVTIERGGKRGEHGEDGLLQLAAALLLGGTLLRILLVARR